MVLINAKGVGDGMAIEVRALPLFVFLHKEISLQVKIMGTVLLVFQKACFPLLC